MTRPRIVSLAGRIAGLLALAATALVIAGRLIAPTAKPAAACAPERLADTGLYADFANGVVRADVLTFVPQYPLWSDGATKRRWIWLPPGTSIDATDPDVWSFPVGTKLWKEFSFGRRVETRFMERLDGRWLYATYAWSADGLDARLAPEDGIRGACESRPGVRFDVPSRLDCLACHQAGRNEVLGFGALQLSSDRDPLAPHAEPLPEGAVLLPELVTRGLVRGLPPQFVAQPPRIAAATPRERAVLGYLHANCGACHSASGKLASLGMALDQPLVGPAGAAAPAIATTLGCASRFQCSAREKSQRIVAGDAEKSLLTRRMASRSPLLQMPPLATHVIDEQALALVVGWIEEELAPSRLLAASSLVPDSNR